MMTQTYKIADVVFSITTIHEKFHDFARDYRSDEQPETELVITEEDIAIERDMSDDARYSDGYLEELAVYRKMMTYLMPKGYVLFHGACVAVDDKGYLFTAPSGTGKTTHTRLWQQVFGPRFRYINGDKPILRMTDKGLVAYGTPWNGKEHYGTNAQVVIAAVVLLGRGEQNSIYPVDIEQSFPVLFGQTYRKTPNESLLAMRFVTNNLGQVPLFRLRCNMDVEAAKVAYRGMNPTLSFEDVLDMEGQLVYSIKGVSMLPLLRQGTDAVVLQKKTDRLKKYDVALFKRKNGDYVLHRVLEVLPDGYRICGDNQYRSEWVTEPQVLAYLTGIVRGQETIDLTSKSYWRYVHLWCDFFYIRAACLWIKAKVHAVYRRLFRRKPS